LLLGKNWDTPDTDYNWQSKLGPKQKEINALLKHKTLVDQRGFNMEKNTNKPTYSTLLQGRCETHLLSRQEYRFMFFPVITSSLDTWLTFISV
jgi:hypothetical protein